MLIGDVRPTTIDGVKSLASQLRKKHGIKHAAALDLAANAANCTNFRNALRTLPARGVGHPYVLLTYYWWERKDHRVGRETLTIQLSKPILDICGKAALKIARGFSDFRMVAEDHFVSDTLADTQDNARRWLCRAERSLRFMEHTGLSPSRDYRKARANGSADDRLPNIDHPTYWVDPASGQFILVDEPYPGAPDEAKRAAWAFRTGWRVAKSSWPGMYNPHNCNLYVATDDRTGYDLDGLVAKIDAIPAPLIEANWSGESSPSWETFVSPMAKTAQDVRRARCRGTIYPVASATTLPFSYKIGSSQRRPAGVMGIDGHTEAGRIIKAVLMSDECPNGVYQRMNSLRSTLEDWMSLEIGRGQLEGPEFFDVYYREAGGGVLHHSRADAIAMLGDLKQRLQAAYPDCAPLRQQLRRIETSVSLLGGIKSSTH